MGAGDERNGHLCRPRGTLPLFFGARRGRGRTRRRRTRRRKDGRSWGTAMQAQSHPWPPQQHHHQKHHQKQHHQHQSARLPARLPPCRRPLLHQREGEEEGLAGRQGQRQGRALTAGRTLLNDFFFFLDFHFATSRSLNVLMRSFFSSSIWMSSLSLRKLVR